MTPEQRKQAEEIISKYETYVRLSQPHNTTPIFLKENVLLMMEEYNQLSAPRIEITEEEILQTIEKSLKSAKLLYIKDDDENEFPLMDLLSYDSCDISTGLKEIENIMDNIALDLYPILSHLQSSGKTEQLNTLTDEEIYAHMMKLRQDILCPAGQMSTGRVILGEVGWTTVCFDTIKWMREKLTVTKSEEQQKGAPFDEEKTMM